MTRQERRKAAGGQGLKRAWAAARKWSTRQLPQVIVFAVIGFAVAWTANALLIALQYGGAGKVPPGSPVTVPGNEAAGAAFWFGLMLVLSSIVSYALAVGPKRFGRGLRQLPENFGALLRADDRLAEHLLWGCAAGLALGVVLSSALSALTTVGLVVLATGPIRWLATGVLAFVFASVLARVRPGGGGSITRLAMANGVLGAAIGGLIAVVIPIAPVKLLGAVLAGVGAFALSRRKAPLAKSAVVILGALLSGFAATLGTPQPVHASDGGWIECGSNFVAWLSCGGPTVLWDSVFGGFWGAAGAAVGAGVGQGVAAGAGDAGTPDPARDLATQIQNDPNIHLADNHVSGVDDNATAAQNIADTANGNDASRSHYENGPGGTVALDQDMMQGMVDLSDDYDMHISEIAGGSHSANSRHYAGSSFDVDQIDGQQVGADNTSVHDFMQDCRDAGATEVLGPGNAGHDHHVHCGWPRP